jgi:Tfp pilus assembly protein PilZ
MKQYTSKFLKFVAALYIGTPVTYLVTVAVLFDIAPAAYWSILLSPGFYFVAALGAVTGYGLWEMKRWSWYLLILTNLLMAWENAFLVHDYGENHHKTLAYLASLGILAGIMYAVSKEIRVPYFFPRIRWWESNPRYKLSVPVKLARMGSDQPIEGEILDLSLGGCFVKLRSGLRRDELIELTFTVFGVMIQVHGAVVWCTQSTVTHPKGVGVKFSLETRVQKRALKRINQRLKKIASLYKRQRYILNQEDFMKRLQELEGQLDKNTVV